MPTVVEAAVASPELSTLVAAVKAAGLVDTLSGEGPFTVFAPNNDAFAKIPAETLDDLLKPENVDQLTAILLRHVVPTVILAAEFPEDITSVDTVGGETITLNPMEATVESSAGKATVIMPDILASNGVIHIVDTVFWFTMEIRIWISIARKMALDNMKVTVESYAGKTTIIMADIIASNRVIHIVDSVLRLPIEIRQRINIL